MAESSSTYSSDTANAERIIARIFVVFGGLFWIIMPLAANTQARYSDLVYRETDLDRIIGDGLGWLIPLGLTVVVFILGLFYEKITAFVLFGAAIATIVWGITQDWYGMGGMALWMTTGVFLVSPMIIAGVLYLLASRTDDMKKRAAA